MFVAAVYDMAMALSIGAALYLIPGRIRRNIREIAAYYRDEGITVTFLPPHMAMKYISIDQESPLRILLSGSEPVRNLDRRLCQQRGLRSDQLLPGSGQTQVVSHRPGGFRAAVLYCGRGGGAGG